MQPKICETYRPPQPLSEPNHIYLGRAAKENGVWLLEEFGEPNYQCSGKHMCVIDLGNILLDLYYGEVFGPEYKARDEYKGLRCDAFGVLDSPEYETMHQRPTVSTSRSPLFFTANVVHSVSTHKKGHTCLNQASLT